jgi:D-alanine-D-alanine ligase
MKAMAPRQKVLVLCGGLSAERDVSLRSGRRVAAALGDVGHEVRTADFDTSLLQLINIWRPDVAIPLLHGAEGEDGSLPTILEVLGLPFVGSPAKACRLAFDKPVANEIVAEIGISVPASFTLPQRVFRELGASGVIDAVSAQAGLPLIIKPTRGGSALGVGVVRSAEEMGPALVAAFAYSETVLIQRLISGTEVAVSVVSLESGLLALPVVEIRPDGDIYDYRARYTAGLTEFFTPARLPDDVREQAESVATRAHAVLGLRDWSRTDMIIDDAGVAWYLETNSAPGMTETSLFPQSVAASGISLADVCSQLLSAAAAR